MVYCSHGVALSLRACAMFGAKPSSDARALRLTHMEALRPCMPMYAHCGIARTALSLSLSSTCIHLRYM